MQNNFYRREKYVEASATSLMRKIPRFGKTSDFARIALGYDAAEDYIIGLLFAAIFVLSTFAAWTIVLLIFKCIGPKRMGYLAGSPFVKGTRRPSIRRIVYLVCAVFFVSFSATFVAKGLSNLKESFTTIVEASRNANAVATDLDSVLLKVQVIGNNVISLRDHLVFALASGGKACLERHSELDPNDDQIILEILSTLNDAIKNAEAFEPDEVEEFLGATDYLMTTTLDFEEGTANIDTGDWQSLVILIPYTIIPLVLVIGVVLAYLGIHIHTLEWVLTWIIHPLFILQVIFASITCSIILMFASANADFCSGGEDNTPDSSVKDILVNMGWKRWDFEYTIIEFYIGQCSSRTPFGFLNEYIGDVESMTARVIEFSGAVATAADTLASVAPNDACVSDLSFIQALNTVMLANLRDVIGRLQDDLGDILECKNIVDIYTVPIYQGTCTYSINGVSWAWASFFVVGLMGMVMIMLRSSWVVDADEDVYAEGKSVVSGDSTEEKESIGNPYNPGRDGDKMFEDTFYEEGLDGYLSENEMTGIRYNMFEDTTVYEEDLGGMSDPGEEMSDDEGYVPKNEKTGI